MSAVAAWGSGQPLVFTSLGPTVYLLVESPLTPRSSPRNVLFGHGIALATGWASVAVTGLLDTPAAPLAGVAGPRAAAVVLALAITAGLIVAVRASHPPAASTALLVSLGVMRTGRELAALAAGVVLLTVVGLAINRARGLPVLRWRAPERQGPSEPAPRR